MFYEGSGTFCFLLRCFGPDARHVCYDGVAAFANRYVLNQYLLLSAGPITLERSKHYERAQELVQSTLCAVLLGKSFNKIKNGAGTSSRLCGLGPYELPASLQSHRVVLCR